MRHCKQAKNMRTKTKFILHDHNPDGLDRRGFLECMAWAGTGMLWAGAGGVFASGVLRPTNVVAAEAKSSVAADFTDQSLVLTTIWTPLLLRAWQRLMDARWITKPSPTFAPKPFVG